MTAICRVAAAAPYSRKPRADGFAELSLGPRWANASSPLRVLTR